MRPQFLSNYNNSFCVSQADITGIPVIRAHSQDVTSLGVAMAAGMAKGVEVWDINSEERELVPSDTFLPTSTEDGKVLRSITLHYKRLLLFLLYRKRHEVYKMENGSTTIIGLGFGQKICSHDR